LIFCRLFILLKSFQPKSVLAPGIAGGDKAKATVMAERIARIDPAEGFSAKARLAVPRGPRPGGIG
jgi:hypothetical protein